MSALSNSCCVRVSVLQTSLMVKYVEGQFNEDYIQTLGVNFMEKSIALRNTEITFSIWDLGGQQEYLHMLPLVCNDAVALLFMFDLSRKSTLTSVKNWSAAGSRHCRQPEAAAALCSAELCLAALCAVCVCRYKQARLLNKTASPFLIGTKYDYFSSLKQEDKADITTQARRFARAMKAPLIFCSASHSINIHKIFKVVLAKVFELRCSVEQISTIGDPIIEYDIDPDTGLPRPQPQQQSAGDEGEGSEKAKSGAQTPEEKAPA
jgi:GTP-binding protein of the ras superfamily involved in termination of M-phase